MTATLLIRADASATIGLGHLMRALAIAQAARDAGHRVILATHGAMPDPLAALWDREAIDIVPITENPGTADEAGETWLIAERHNVSCILIDGYHFTADFFSTLSPRGRGQGEGERFRLAALHDLPSDPPPAVDILINPNPGVTPTHYAHYAGALHCGSEYTPLQRHIAAQAQQPRPTNSRTLFASFGGSDGTQLSEWLCTHLDALREARITLQLVCGPTNPRRAMLEYFFRDDPTHRLLAAPAPEQFAQHAHAARAAFVAAGSTCWELAALGVPQWAIVTAPNQHVVADGLGAHGWGRASSRAILPDLVDLIAWFETVSPPAQPLHTHGAARCVTALLT